MKMFNKSQVKLVVFFVIVLFSFFTLLNTTNAALTPSDSIYNAVDLANSGEVIELEGGGKFLILANETNIMIDKKITIKSNDSSKNAIINLGKNNRAFNILNNGNLTLINITIANGSNVDRGGAIYNNGILTIEGCTFTENHATSSSHVFGGAIYNENGNVTITKSTFTKNNASATATATSATSSASAIAYVRGGAIYNENGNVTITKSTFTKNNASATATATALATALATVYVRGGAIYNENGNVTITKSTFTKNNASATATATSTTSATAFASVNVHGGAIYNRGSSLEVFSSVFFKNSGVGYTSIESNDNIVLVDNFYFWVLDCNNTDSYYHDLDGQISKDISSTNNYHGSYYYMLLSYDPKVISGNDLVLDYSMKHSGGSNLDGLTVSDISLRIADIVQNDFIYDSLDLRLDLSVDGTDLVTLNYFDEEFYIIPYIIPINTTLTLISGDVSGNVGDVVELIAILKDIDNNVLISGARVDFYVDGVFVGNNTTDAYGVAIFYYTLPSGLDSTYYVQYDGNNTYNRSTSVFGKIAIIFFSMPKPIDPVVSNSQMVLFKDVDTYFVGDYIVLTWTTTNITDSNAMGTIYFYENGKLQHNIQVRLSDGRLVYQFKKSHKSLNIVLRFSGDDTTSSSQSTVSAIVYDKFIVNIIPGVLTVAKRGYINISVTDLNGKAIGDGFITLQFDSYDVFRVPVVNGVAQFSKVLMKAGNSRLLRVSYVDSSNITRVNVKRTVRVNKGTPVMTLSLNPNTKTISNRVAITTTVSNGVIKQKYVNIPYTIRFYSSGKLAHTINKKFGASSNSFVYNFKRTHSNLIITATLGTTPNYNRVTKKSSTLVVA